ncbi:MAG: GNAT family N-acetyltransferase [Chloroflexi bacterium]|nr:GNAT family N-acetyltransferase [Chloroflexota bacterium]
MLQQVSKVLIREKKLSDSANDYAWAIDPELCRLDATVPLSMSFRDALMMYEEELLYPAPRRKRFAVDTADGTHIGNCMFYDVDEAKGQAELGIMIGNRRYWSKGYGTEAVKGLLTLIFAKTKLNRIYLHTLEWNIRAQKAFKKAGFTEIGPVRRNGYDFIEMEITRGQWEEMRRGEDSPAQTS